MNKVLFLGSNSFSGSHFKAFIYNHGLRNKYCFVGTDKEAEDSLVNEGIRYLQLNILDEPELERILIIEKPDFIMNFIGIFHGESYGDYFKINTDVARNIFEIIFKNNLPVKKVLLIGSAAEYGQVNELPVKEDSKTEPVSLYGISKLMQTHIARFYFNSRGIPMNVARTFNIIGNGISKNLSVGNFIDQINNAKEGGMISTGNLKTRRDYLHIDDVIEAYWEILINGHDGEIYNVCSAKSFSMEEIFTHLINASGKTLSFKINESLVKNNDIPEIYGDNTKLKNHTSWYPKKDILSMEAIRRLICKNL